MSALPDTVIVELLATGAATETPLGRIARDFVTNPIAIFGIVLLLLVVLAAILAPFISPQNPYDLAQLDVMDSRLEPGSKALTGGTYWLGTDDQGRDMLSAIFYGLRISLSVGVASTVLALLIGLTMGLAAAYLGGRVETLIMRIVDIQLSFPAILIALILIAVLGQGTGKVIAALVTVQWAYYARTVRSAALVEKRKEYMEAARCLALPPSPQLPPADDRRRDGAGCCGDRSRGHALVSRARPADHGAIAWTSDRQRLSIFIVGKILDQLFPGRRAARHDRQHQPRRRSTA